MAVTDESRKWVADVVATIRSGDWPKAVRQAEFALSRGVLHPRLLYVRAIGRERAGRIADAVTDLERAYDLDPEDVGIAVAFGAALTRQGHTGQAVKVLKGAVTAAPDMAECWRALAEAEMAAGEVAAAGSSYERLVALEPHAGEGWGKLAVLASHRGERNEARRLGLKGLALDPANADAHRAGIEADLDERRFSAAEDAALAWLARADLGLNARHHAAGLLGDALEGQGRFSQAFEAYTRSGQAFHDLHQRAFAGLDAAPLRETFATMEKGFAHVPPGAWRTSPRLAPPDKQARTHVFLMGFMRSGTTLLEQALGRHPDVATLEEVEAFAGAGADRLWRPNGMKELSALGLEEAEAMRAAYWEEVDRRGVAYEGKAFIDKLPFNGAKLPLIAALFPGAKILFAVRDPRDVVLSCFQKRLQPNGYAYEMSSLDGAARLYDAYMSLVRRYRAALPLQILDHRHEALVADFEGSVREVCNFIGLDIRPEMIDFQVRASAGGVASQTARQLGQGLNARGVGRWRSYAGEMAPVLPLLRPWAEHYGYTAD